MTPMRLADLWTVPSAITAVRFVFAATVPWWFEHPAALAIYVTACVSDMLDGEVARRTGTCTRAGAVLDAWVDKALHVNLGWSLALADRIPDAWMLAWCAREILQAPMVFVCAYRFRTATSVPPATTLWGRATAVSLFAAVCATLLGFDATFATVVTGVCGVVAGIDYGWRYLPVRAGDRSLSISLEPDRSTP